MSLSHKQLALLHVAKTKLGLDDATYRTALIRLGGVTTATELDQEGFEALLAFFEYSGFRPLERTGPDYGIRPGMASFAQLELIRQLWVEWSGSGIDNGLDTWLKAHFKRDSLRFVTKADAARIITALRAMKARKQQAA
jgi:phage gp16-like protein